MAFTYIKVSVATGVSVNTAFSAIYSALPQQPFYHVVVQNNTSSVVNFAVATSAPTATALDQFFVPSSGYAWVDCMAGETLANGGGGNLNLYARVDESAIVSGAIRVLLK